jgi:hypothetical protein
LSHTLPGFTERAADRHRGFGRPRRGFVPAHSDQLRGEYTVYLRLIVSLRLPRVRGLGRRLSGTRQVLHKAEPATGVMATFVRKGAAYASIIKTYLCPSDLAKPTQRPLPGILPHM